MRQKRGDLLALTDDALVSLANRGLVKRATKDVDAGNGPAIEVDEGLTVLGRFADGTVATLPAGAALGAGSCSCPVNGICRHLLAVVLAYQRAHDGGATADAPVRWTPAEFDDDALEALLGARTLAAARRVHKLGYGATVRRPTAGVPVPEVELSSCTVRFLVPHELGYVYADAAKGKRDEVVALAVWAFREADLRAPDADELQLDAGGTPAASAGTTSGIEHTLDIAAALLLDGVVQSGASAGVALARGRRDLETANLRWPLLALDEIADQLDAYHARSARYSPGRLASLVVELHARHRAATGASPLPRSRVLGVEEHGDTPMRRVQLSGLGCRVLAAGNERTAEAFLAHAGSGEVLVIRKRWDFGDEEAPTGHELGRRRMAQSATLASLASANVVSESVVRSASRLLRIGSSRVARTTISPSAGDWGALPDSLLVGDVDRLVASMDSMPPRLIRPRVEAELVRVIATGEVLSIGYHPGAQRLDAVVAGRDGGTFTISSVHRSACPAALDAIAEALSGGPGSVRFVSGPVRRFQGRVVVDPLAVVTASGVVVPDLAPGTGSTELEQAAAGAADDTVAAALDGALAVVAEAAHRGLAHVPPTFADRLRAAAAQLARVGLRRTSDAVIRLAATLGPDPGQRAVDAWVDAELRLLVTAELR